MEKRELNQERVLQDLSSLIASYGGACYWSTFDWPIITRL